MNCKKLIVTILTLCMCQFVLASPASIDDAIRQAGTDLHKLKNVEVQLIGILKSEVSITEKEFALRRLSRIASSDSVGQVAKLLTDPDLSHMARSVLESVGRADSEKALLDALDKTESELKIGVISSLGRLKAKTATQKLLALSVGNEIEIAKVSVNALGKIGGKDIANQLADIANNSPATVHAEIIDARLNIADDLKKEGDKKTAAVIYTHIYRQSNTDSIKIAAFRGLSQTDVSEAKSLIKEVLKSNNRQLLSFVSRFLAESKDEKLVKGFVKKIFKYPPHGQVALLDCIKQRGYKKARKNVLKAVVSDDIDVSVAAINALSAIGDAEDVMLLVGKAANGKEAEVVASRNTLKTLPGKKINKAMAGYLSKADSKSRVEIIDSLVFRQAASQIDDVAPFVDDQDASVSKSALIMLGEFGDERHIKLGVDLLGSADSKKRRNAEKALKAIAKRTPAQSLDTILAYFDKLPADSRCALLRVFATIKLPRSLAAIRTAVNDSDGKINSTAVKVLSNYRSIEVLPDLLNIVQNSDDLKNKVLAFRGYVRIVRQYVGSSDEKLRLLLRIYDAASRDQERKMVVSALADAPSLKTLKQLQVYLDNDSLRQEAAFAALGIAEKLEQQYPEDVKNALEKIVALNVGGQTADKAKLRLEKIIKFKGRLLHEWEFDNSTGTWIAENHCKVSIDNGQLLIKAIGEDPFISTPIDVPAGPVEMQIQLQSDTNQGWQIFYGSDQKDIYSQPLWIEGFNVSALPGQWQMATVILNVEGKLNKVRLDIAGFQTAKIDWIRLLKAE